MRERLLLVDDEQSILTFCTRTLLPYGYDVRSALSAEAALALLGTERFDLLATDIRMPGMSGLELMRHALDLRADMAVIVITGMGTFDVSVQALRAGAHDFLAKPFGASQLLQAVEHALQQARLIRETARLRLLEPLLALSQQALYNRDVESLSRSILQVAIAQTKATGAVLALSDPGMTFSIRLSAEELRGCEQAFAQSSGQVQVWTPEALGISDAERGERNGTPRTLVHAPLTAPRGVVGHLVISLARAATQLDQSDLDLVSALAGQAAALLENTLLMQRLEEWNRTLEQRVQQRTQELEAAQERLLRAERLAAVGQFGSSIAHELRNPLGVISNSVYYLNMRLGDADEKLRKHLDILTREVQASNKIITNLMSYVRVGQLHTQAIAPSNLVMEVLERAQIPAQVRLVTDVPEDLPLLSVDRDKMHQVLLNLIDNAVQAMPHGGALSIRAYIEEGTLCLAVADNGEGIPRENLERIFEPLFSTKARGIGLGLAIVKMLVEAHGGTIDVVSQPGQGTTFTLHLPVCVRNEVLQEMCA